MMDIDRELDAALDVDPSPDFTARVRTKISQMPAPSDRRLAMALAAGVGVVLAIGLMTASRREGDSAQSINLARTAPVVSPSRIAKAPAGKKGRSLGEAPLVVVSHIARTPRRRAEPGVLVPKGEAQALRDLYTALHDGRVNMNDGQGDYTFIGRGSDDELAAAPAGFELVPSTTSLGGVRQ